MEALTYAMIPSPVDKTILINIIRDYFSSAFKHICDIAHAWGESEWRAGISALPVVGLYHKNIYL